MSFESFNKNNEHQETQETLAKKYLKLNEERQELMRQYQLRLTHRNSLKEESHLPNDAYIVDEEKTMKDISEQIDVKQRFMNNIFDKLSTETKEKFLREPEKIRE